MDKDSSYNPQAYGKEHLLSTVRALESESYELANMVLAESEVTVGVIENHPIDNALPEEIIDFFVRVRPSYATAINLGLRYDKINRFFMPTAAAIKLDNGAVIDFSQSRRMAEVGQFYMQVLDSAGVPLASPPPNSTFGTYTSYELENILSSVGLELPHYEQPAEWSAIGHILGSSKKWHSVAEQSIVLGPERQVLVRDTVDGGKYDIDETPEALLEPIEVWQRTLVVGLDSTKSGSLLPNSSLQLSFKSDNPFEVPKYDDISRVPIVYGSPYFEFFVPEFIENPEIIRSELDDKRKPVLPNVNMLDSLRNSVLEARLSIEETNLS